MDTALQTAAQCIKQLQLPHCGNYRPQVDTLRELFEQHPQVSEELQITLEDVLHLGVKHAGVAVSNGTDELFVHMRLKHDYLCAISRWEEARERIKHGNNVIRLTPIAGRAA